MRAMAWSPGAGAQRASGAWRGGIRVMGRISIARRTTLHRWDGGGEGRKKERSHKGRHGQGRHRPPQDTAEREGGKLGTWVPAWQWKEHC